MIAAMMGVAGSGKTTIGGMVAAALQVVFVEGDELHPAANVAKMSAGLPLTDADRAPWLAAVKARMQQANDRGESLVVACSALKQAYRSFLESGLPVTWVYLKVPADVLRDRLERRTHFMKAGMLPGQLEALEEPSNAIVIDGSRPARAVVEEILVRLKQARA